MFPRLLGHRLGADVSPAARQGKGRDCSVLGNKSRPTMRQQNSFRPEKGSFRKDLSYQPRPRVWRTEMPCRQLRQRVHILSRNTCPQRSQTVWLLITSPKAAGTWGVWALGAV